MTLHDSKMLSPAVLPPLLPRCIGRGYCMHWLHRRILFQFPRYKGSRTGEREQGHILPKYLSALARPQHLWERHRVVSEEYQFADLLRVTDM
jgi:hypothetical protein